MDPEEIWLFGSLARGDFAHIEAFGKSPDMADRIFGFHARQAAEKALKAWMAVLGLQYLLAHQMRVLLDRLDESRQGATEGLWRLVRLTPFAVQIRYGTLAEGPADRDRLLRQLASLLGKVEHLVRA